MAAASTTDPTGKKPAARGKKTPSGGPAPAEPPLPFWMTATTEPDWRSRRAQQIFNSPNAKRRVPGTHDDQLVKDYLKFLCLERRLRAKKRCESAIERELRARFDAIWQAHQFYVHTEPSENRLARIILEVKLLADQECSYADIGREMNMSAAGVEQYHELFYCVRPFLKSQDWVIGKLFLGKLPYVGDCLETTLKFWTYFGGLRFFYLFLCQLDPSTGLSALKGFSLEQELDHLIDLKSRVRLLMTLTQENLKAGNLRELQSACLAARKLASEHGSDSGTPKVFEEIIKAMRDMIPVPLGDEPVFQLPPLTGLISSQVEIRPEERSLLAQGIVPNSLLRYIDPEWTPKGNQAES